MRFLSFESFVAEKQSGRSPIMFEYYDKYGGHKEYQVHSKEEGIRWGEKILRTESAGINLFLGVFDYEKNNGVILYATKEYFNLMSKTPAKGAFKSITNKERFLEALLKCIEFKKVVPYQFVDDSDNES